MNGIPPWVKWFGDLVAKIDEDKLRNLDKEDGPDWGNKNIDPFSFILYFAQTFNYEPERKNQVSDVFNIDNHGVCFIPTLRWPGDFREDDEKDCKYADNTESLWKLFRQARQGIKKIEDEDFAINFAIALGINDVGLGKLTLGLFFINPKDFFPIIEATMPIIQEKLRGHKYFELCSLKKLKNQIENGEQGWIDYKCLLSEFKSVSNGKPFYEIYEEWINAEE